MFAMSRRTFGKSMAAGAVGLAAVGTPDATAAEDGDTYLIGAGIYDVTGAVAETGAFGYAANQTMTGLHERLYAHAFVFGTPAGTYRLVQLGDWKNGWNGRVTAYTGTSRPFTVR